MASKFTQGLLALVGLNKAPVAVSAPPTYYPGASAFRLPSPGYRDHLIDVTEVRTLGDVKTIMEWMASADPDVSAAINAYLTVADTEFVVEIRNAQGELEADAYPVWNQLLMRMGFETDLTKGFQKKPSLKLLCEQARMMCLFRGAVGAELVVDDFFRPTEIRLVDAGTLNWYQKVPGELKPKQWPRGGTVYIDLDIPTFFYAGYRNSPFSAYPMPPFVSAINTIVARAQIMNDLYRIMQMTGFPRIDVQVLEEIIRNSAPASVKADPKLLQEWINSRIQDIRVSFAGLAPDEAFVHTDATEVKMVNEKAAAATLNIESVISTLNAQNQAGLKSVSTILGRGTSGVNTASVEARVFAMNADGLNNPVAEVLSKLFTCAFQLAGLPYFVQLCFRPAEMRPQTELEPQYVMRQTRLLELLSYGVISDEEFSMTMLGRLPNADAPKMSGTNFLLPPDPLDTSKVSPNSDPLGKSLAAPGSKSARSNRSGGPGSAQTK